MAEQGAARWSLFFLVTVGRGSVLRPITPEASERLLQWLADLAGNGGPVISTTEAPQFQRVLLKRSRGHESPSRPVRSAGIQDGNGIMFISHTGEITPSGFFPFAVGDVRTSDPVVAYREAAIFHILRRLDLLAGRCGVCEFRGPCGGSRARAYAASGDALGEDLLCGYHPQQVANGLQPETA